MHARITIFALALVGCAPPPVTPGGDGGVDSSGGAPGSDSEAEGSDAADDGSSGGGTAARRVPAEWEPQAAVWMQWPQAWESHFEPAFVEIVEVIAAHEPVHLLAAHQGIADQGRARLSAAGVPSDNITWHIVPNDNAWMRDNGPRYVVEDGEMLLQDWGFDGWGGNFGPRVTFADDDRVPIAVGELLGLPVEPVDMVHERGDLELNGQDTAIVNWSVVSDRNPELSRADATAIFEAALGVSSVIYLEGFHPDDGTTGHVDGLARFISASDVVVGQVSDPGSDPVFAELFEDVAEQIAAQRPDLTMHRLSFPADTDYMNWLVGNGFVLSGGFANPAADEAARVALSGYFPGRTVYTVDVSALWADGGGIHCVTNDQPLLP